ncbi:hypothetical protein OAQ99_04930 [Candidatus Kapabacteria bacterium]|nr:hypothetical protein [Candidatus Kapabacteria bacterium]
MNQSKIKIIGLAIVSAIVFWLIFKKFQENNPLSPLKVHFSGDFENDIILESWNTSQNSIIGKVFNSSNEPIENLLIFNIDSQIFLAAKPIQNDKYTFFFLENETKNIFLFSNSEHNFPKYIKYEFTKDSVLTTVWNESSTITSNLTK